MGEQALCSSFAAHLVKIFNKIAPISPKYVKLLTHNAAIAAHSQLI